MRPAFIGGLVSAEPIKGDWAALDDPVPHLGLVIVVGRQRVVEMPHVLVVEDEGVDGVGGPGQREVLSAFGGFLRQLTAPRAGVGKPGDPRCEIGGNRRRNQCEKGGQAVSEHSRAEPQPNAGDAARRKAPCESRKAEDGDRVDGRPLHAARKAEKDACGQEPRTSDDARPPGVRRNVRRPRRPR